MGADQRQGEQQCRQELAGNVAPHPDRLIQPQRGLADAQRRIAALAEVVDVAAQLVQRVNQICDRSLMHARDTGELEFAPQQGQCRRQRAHCSACIAEKQSRRSLRRTPAQTGHRNGLAGSLDAAAQLLQRVQHHSCVVGVKDVLHHGHTLTQGCQQQYAIGNAFGARQADTTAGAFQRRQIEKRNVEHGNYLVLRVPPSRQ